MVVGGHQWKIFSIQGNMPPVKWTTEKSVRFWSAREDSAITSDPHLERRNRQRLDALRQREERRNANRHAFVQRYRERANDEAQPLIQTTETDDIAFWIRHMSWTYCAACGGLVPQKMLPSFRNRRPIKPSRTCSCSNERYSFSSPDEVPLPLLDLTNEQLLVLRPFDIHTGDFEKRQHGYQVHTSPFRVYWSKTSVVDKINAVADPTSRRRCSAAYHLLMNADSSDYKKFVQMRDRATKDPWTYEIFTNDAYKGIECALWPNLYYRHDLCESHLEGHLSRLSGKVSYMSKVFSPMLDYSLSYEMLHYQYDRWMFKTITGAINSARAARCSPAKSLDEKTFSYGFWQWQHRFLIDAVRQHGFPSFFITISPYEWTFPFPPWLENIREVSGRAETELPIVETIHIAHVLEQLVRGHICGSNTNRWRQHVFTNQSSPASQNVRNYFYRFEFQDRGTAHLHLLVWLEDVEEIRADLLNATIPWQRPEEAFLVTDLQHSDRTVLPLQSVPSHFRTTDSGTTIAFRYTQEELARNLRAYITTVLGSLKCRTDVQATDGKGMVLKYASSYVSKCHSGSTSEILHSHDLSGFQAANSFLRTLRPLAPEMALSLTSTKMAWTGARTKRITAPHPDSPESNSSYCKYLARPTSEVALSFVEWLRAFNDSNNPPKRYKAGCTLVGVKTTSIFNPVYFFQQVVMFYPHTDANALRHPQEHELPECIQFFVQASLLQPQLWKEPAAIQTHLSCEAHKSHYIDTVLNFIASLHDIYRLWSIRVVTREINTVYNDVTEVRFPLSSQQTAILDTLLQRIDERDDFLAGNARNPHHSATRTTTERTDESEWLKVQLLLGKPGTGKSQVLIRLIHRVINDELKVTVGAPLAILANKFRLLFGDDVKADTVHSLFNIPVTSQQRHTVNYDLATTDVLIIDEASMIPRENFALITATLNKLPKRPILILAGDKCQQQPLATVDGRITQLRSILNDDTLNSNSAVFTLYRQFRCTDPGYASFLDFIRFSMPTQQMLDTFQRDNLLYTDPPLNDFQLWQAVSTQQAHTLLTVSRAAADRVNGVVLNNVFTRSSPITDIPCDSGTNTFQVYQGMQVMITQNRDKKAGVINGQAATVINAENRTVLLKLSNGHTVFTHPITSVDQQGQRSTTYPFTPSYAMTICKSQGATLEKLLLWLDCTSVPPGTSYVGLSRVRRKEDITFLTPMSPQQLQPVDMTI